jgi:hypothetical protein
MDMSGKTIRTTDSSNPLARLALLPVAVLLLGIAGSALVQRATSAPVSTTDAVSSAASASGLSRAKGDFLPTIPNAAPALTLYEGMTGMMENTFVNVKGRSLTITAEVNIPQGGANGVILAQGGRFGGWSLYVKDGRPAYVYNWTGLEHYTVAAPEPAPAGKATITLDFAYDGGGHGKGGTATLSVNGKKVAEGRIAHTNATMFSMDEGADVGVDEDTPVTEAYVAGVRSRFAGKIDRVTVDLKRVSLASEVD